jgi:hypothetical protein
MARLANPMPQLFRGGDKSGIYMAISRTKYTYLHAVFQFYDLAKVLFLRQKRKYSTKKVLNPFFFTNFAAIIDRERIALYDYIMTGNGGSRLYVSHGKEHKLPILM